MQLSERMACEIGVMCLPVEFFLSAEEIAQGENAKWVRFSVVNVDEERVKAVCKRLGEITTTFGWELDC